MSAAGARAGNTSSPPRSLRSTISTRTQFTQPIVAWSSMRNGSRLAAFGGKGCLLGSAVGFAVGICCGVGGALRSSAPGASARSSASAHEAAWRGAGEQLGNGGRGGLSICSLWIHRPPSSPGRAQEKAI